MEYSKHGKVNELVALFMEKLETGTDLSAGSRTKACLCLGGLLDKTPIDFWTIPDIQKFSVEVTGNRISSDLAGTVCEMMYSNMGQDDFGFSHRFVSEQIVGAFHERFSKVLLFPATTDTPPEFPVGMAIAEQFISVGILKDPEPPQRAGDAEIISELGDDQISVAQYAAKLAKMTGKEVEIVEEPDADPDISPRM